MAIGSACAPSHGSSTTAKELAAQLIVPPGYEVDHTPGANGYVTPGVFLADAGGGSAKKSGFIGGFIGGFKQNYSTNNTAEGIAITLFRFDSAADATAYLQRTAPVTLTVYGATQRPFPKIPGAIRLDGTKLYNHGFAHAVIATRGSEYMFLVYLVSAPAPAPIEFDSWVFSQYNRI